MIRGKAPCCIDIDGADEIALAWIRHGRRMNLGEHTLVAGQKNCYSKGGEAERLSFAIDT